MKKVHMAALPKIKTIEVTAGVRYWEDTKVNGEPDNENGDKIPLKSGECWQLTIDAETGVIKDWTPGMRAEVHYKVCDHFSALFKDAEGKVVVEIEEEYVPDFMCPKEEGHGDYIIMNIGEDGKIEDWDFSDDMVTNDLHEDDED